MLKDYKTTLNKLNSVILTNREVSTSEYRKVFKFNLMINCYVSAYPINLNTP